MITNVELRPTYEECVAQLTGAAAETGPPMQEEARQVPAHPMPEHKEVAHAPVYVDTGLPIHEQEVPPAHPTQTEEPSEPVADKNISRKKKRTSAAPPPMRTSNRIRAEPKRLKF